MAEGNVIRLDEYRKRREARLLGDGLPSPRGLLSIAFANVAADAPLTAEQFRRTAAVLWGFSGGVVNPQQTRS